VEVKKQVEQALGEVLVPSVERSLAQLNMVREIEVTGKEVRLKLAATALNPEAQELVKSRVKQALKSLPGANRLALEFVPAKPKDLNQIGRVIAVMSGKGGVGKSLVTGLIAVALRRQGKQVGILDADLTGPSIPKMFGISARPGGSDTGILPVLSNSGIELISINLLLSDEGDAVIWRGPLIGKAITQFWQDVVWGRLDYLLVDLPPGTADAPLTVMQSLPLNGVIIVFTPQDLTTMIVKKAINMAQMMSKPILGVVENMSYLYVPEIDKRIELFGQSKAQEMSKVAHAPVLGQLPIDPELASLCDKGMIESYRSDAFTTLADNFSRAQASSFPVKKD